MQDNVVAIIQARMTSKRLPGKVLLPLFGAPLLHRMLERVSRINGLDAIWLAIPEGQDHDPIVDILPTGVRLFRGSETDVLDRTFKAAKQANATVVMRMTSDCPLIDPTVSSDILVAFKNSPAVYARTALASGYPHGFDTEVFTIDALESAHAEATTYDEREHVTPFIWRQPNRFPTLEVDHYPDFRHWRVTVDTPEDYQLAKQIYDILFPQNPNFGFEELRKLFTTHPELLEINANIIQPKLAGIPESNS